MSSSISSSKSISTTDSSDIHSFRMPSPSLSSGSIKTDSTGRSTLSSTHSSSSTKSRTHTITVSETPEIKKLRQDIEKTRAKLEKIGKNTEELIKKNAEWDFKLTNHKRGSTLLKVALLTCVFLITAPVAPVIALGAFVAIPLVIAGDTCRYVNETAPKRSTTDPTITIKAK